MALKQDLEKGPIDKEDNIIDCTKDTGDVRSSSLVLDQFIDRNLIKLQRFVSLIAFRCKSKFATISVRLLEKERDVADFAALYVDKTDARIDKMLDRTGEKLLSSVIYFLVKWHALRAWAWTHKKRLLAGLAAGTSIGVAVSLFIGGISAYEYMYNGEVLGVVKNQKSVYSAVNLIGDKLSKEYGAEIKIDKDENISFRRVLGFNLSADNDDEILNTFTYLSEVDAKAYAIVVEGKPIAILDNKNRAEGVLSAVKDRYTKKDSNVKYESVKFAEAVSIEKIEVKIKDIQAEDDVVDYMMTGATEKRIHTVQNGETFNQIAKDYGLKPAELEASNPGVKPDKLQIGQEITLTRICPVLTVQTRETATYIADIDYDIDYEETSTLYKGEKTVKISGIPGEKKVVAEIIRENGIEVHRKEISTELIKEPRTQVVLKGTKNPPPLIGSGTYVYPTRGTLSSRFGIRWGRMHSGIDIAAPSGSKICASDGGKVVFAGWDGSLGYCVRIDHGSNRITVYGHCSKILVSKGDKVYQGQHIANVGNTGRSTGPHVHFEVRINGVAKNPLNYLK